MRGGDGCGTSKKILDVSFLFALCYFHIVTKFKWLTDLIDLILHYKNIYAPSLLCLLNNRPFEFLEHFYGNGINNKVKNEKINVLD